MSNDANALDRILSAPLPAIPDAGFSARVITRIVTARERLVWLELAAILAASGLTLAFLPVSALAATIEKLTFSIGFSLPLAIAAVAIMLSGSLDHTLPD
jgi:hypothetical protein